MADHSIEQDEQDVTAEEARAEVVEARTTDVYEETGSEQFTKLFRVAYVGVDELEADDPFHAANKLVVLETAIQQGLHPKGDVELVKTELVSKARRGMETWDVVYAVDVLPASDPANDHYETVTAGSYLSALGGTTADGDNPEGALSPAGQAQENSGSYYTDGDGTISPDELHAALDKTVDNVEDEAVNSGQISDKPGIRRSKREG